MDTISTSIITTKRVFIVMVLLALLLTALAPTGLAASLPATGSGIPTLGIVQQWSITAPDPAVLDEFGYSVALDGNTAVVGARNADPNVGGGPIEDAGAAFVYTYNGKTWILEAELTAKHPEAGDTFGVSVAISGNTIIVGATGVDLEDQDEEDNEVKDVGAAYIFSRVSGEWEQQAVLTAHDRAEDDSFGSSVAIYKNTAVIAAETKTFNTGSVYVFFRSGVKDWKEQAKLEVFPLSFNFGASVAIYGDLLAVGSTQFNPLKTSGNGEVFLYRRSGKLWLPEAQLEAEDGRAGDAFGNSVAMYGSTVVVGAQHADPDLGSGRVTSAGAAYVFTDNGDKWEEEAVLTAYDGLPFDQLGRSVDIYGNTIVVGAAGATQAGNSGAGAVYVYTKKNGTWSQATRAVTDPTSEDDNFGQAVGVYRDWFVVGASGRDPNSKVRAGQVFLNKLGSVQLPSTGFAPGQITLLPPQPASLAYQNYGEMWLEIPALGEKMTIMGVPKGDTGWDVRWLSNEAGYLEGTSFPTWPGNTGLAGHTVLPDGKPGPFAKLQTLRWGDQVIIHAWGQRYIYEVRDSSLVLPNMLNVLKHEDLDWVTLITCEGFNEFNGKYFWRRVVRAVLITVQEE